MLAYLGTSLLARVHGQKRMGRLRVVCVCVCVCAMCAGTGTQVVPGTRVTVEGLRSNDTYVFAIAAYDESGALIGELGTSSVEILAGRC